MAIPSRLTDEQPGMFFVSTNAAQGRNLLQSDRMASLFVSVLQSYRKNFRLHEFVVMPNHIHVLITPLAKVSAAVQLFKGGFSFRAGKEFGLKGEIWQRGFSEHCLRDEEDYQRHKTYIWNNPVKAGLVGEPPEFKYSSASGLYELDARPESFRRG